MTDATTHAVEFTVCRSSVRVGGLTAEQRDRLLHEWARCHAQAVPDDESIELRPRRGEDWDTFHERAIHRATSEAIDSGVGSQLMLHAAALALPETGATIVLAAESGTGKTTATRTLGTALAYLTDETAMIDPVSFALSPYAKPLSVLGPSGRRPKRQHAPDDLGLLPEVDGVLQRVAVLDRVRHGDEDVAACAEPATVGEVLPLLVPQTSSLCRLPRGLVTLCETLDRTGGAVRLVYREAADLVPVVQELLSHAPEPAERGWDPLDDHELGASVPADDIDTLVPAGALRRVAVDDGLFVEDGRLALLHGTRLSMLDGLGPALWLLLDAPRTPEQLLDLLAESGPLPEDARERLDAAVNGLRGRGLLALA